MSLLKGNYKLKKEWDPKPEEQQLAEDVLEEDYYKAAMNKLGGSIAFIMKDRTFIWKGEDSAKDKDPVAKEGNSDG